MLKGLAYGVSLTGIMLISASAYADAPLTSLRPVPRPTVIYLSPSAMLAPLASPRPRARPDAVQSETTIANAVQVGVIEKAITDDVANNRTLIGRKEQKNEVVAQAAAFISPFAALRSLLPKKRPKGLQVASIDPETLKTGKPVRYRKKGSVCGVKGIRGYSVARVQGKIGGCRIDNPVRINEVDGIKLTREVLIGCEAAKSLYSWVSKSAKPAVGRRGGGLAKVQTIAGYSCRNRNNKKGGKLSEHAKGKAIDISGFVLKDGSTLSVLKDWRSASKGPTLKRLHKTACGPFGTVLGPNANRYHQDHFHFDVARYRSKNYCR